MVVAIDKNFDVISLLYSSYFEFSIDFVMNRLIVLEFVFIHLSR